LQLAGTLSSEAALGGRWELAWAAAGSEGPPAEGWQPAPGAAVVAALVPEVSREALLGRDWWYRARFDVPDALRDCSTVELTFGGLATVCQVWLNDAKLIDSEDMFLSHSVACPALRPAGNQLLLRFAALQPLLDQRRPRPSWKAAIVPNQALRWLRTTQLGHMTSWGVTPPLVGPWRPVRLRGWRGPRIASCSLRAGLEGAAGRLDVELRVELPPQLGGSQDGGSTAGMRLSVGEHEYELPRPDRDGWVRASVRVADVEPWWPHTLGAPRLYPVCLEVAGRRHALGQAGFRRIEFEPDRDARLHVNGVPLFARGASWMPDPVTFDRPTNDCERTLRSLLAAGANVVRVPANSGYESHAFYGLCDSLGLLVWQDLPFASLDYPLQDQTFRELALAEVRQFCRGFGRHPSLAVVCGSSEITLQARNFSRPLPEAAVRFFETEAAAEAARTGAAYVPFTPSRPAQAGAAPAVDHYYGVSAYLRPLSDASAGATRFATECLAFSNVPEDSTLRRQFSAEARRSHHPAWKAGVPRDRLAGWDFEDIRDHYFRELTGADPFLVRYSDPEHYLAMGRRVTGYAMAAAMRAWRANPACGGALTWTVRDLLPGAGWGILDALGRPKAPYFCLAPLWQPVAVLLADGGLAGLSAQLLNDTAEPVSGALRLSAWTWAGACVASGSRDVRVDPRSRLSLAVDEILGGFLDLTRAYRYGPPAADLVHAAFEVNGRLASEDTYLPGQLRAPSLLQPRIQVETAQAPASQREQDPPRATEGPLREAAVVLTSDLPAVMVSLDFDGWRPEASYLTLLPDRPRRVRLRAADGEPASRLRGAIDTLASTYPLEVDLPL
jgi:beta-mannosidase